MVHPDEIKKQLAGIGANSLMWGRAELRELPKILFEGERLNHVLNGRYEGGFAVLCATNYRVILIDKKPFYLTLEDTRYDMISDVQFNHRLIDASIWIGTVHKKMTFMAYNHAKLRNMTHFIQEQVMATRQQQTQPEIQPEAIQAPLPPQPLTGNLPPAQQLPVVEGALASAPQRPPINPYRTPLMIRHRISRY